MADLDLLLEKTSRTFALSIPRLPDPTRREVTVAYLLFRIADTFEDSERWPPERRLEALRRFEGLVEDPDPAEARRTGAEWARERPIDHTGYIRLLRETPDVLEAYAELRDPARTSVREHTLRTSRGMRSFVARAGDDGVVRLGDLEELRAYCYAVAGIVGELLTELFLLGRPGLGEVAGLLRDRAPLFGEGLQLVNILRDSSADVREGRSYLPPTVEREELFELARADLDAAEAYGEALARAGAPEGILAFVTLPVKLAWATLARVEEEGAGAKLTRPEVFGIIHEMEATLAGPEPAGREGGGRSQSEQATQ